MFDFLPDLHRDAICEILNSEWGIPAPDKIIAPDGEPYLYRWHVIPKNDLVNIYLHLQVSSDSDRGCHDHPWDNTSVILAGGYEEETYSRCGPVWVKAAVIKRNPGDVIRRSAEEPHRLALSEPYSLSLFVTGPVRRDWGFWIGGQWQRADRIVEVIDGISRRK